MTRLLHGSLSAETYFIEKISLTGRSAAKGRGRLLNKCNMDLIIFRIVIFAKMGYYIIIKARRYGYGSDFMVDRHCGVYRS